MIDSKFIWGVVVGAAALFAINYFFNVPSMKDGS